MKMMKMMKVKLDLLLVVLLCLELDCGSADPDPLQVFRSGLGERPLLVVPLKEALGRPGVRVRTVLVNCFPTHMEVWVKSDLFGLGMQVDPADLRLGPDGPAGPTCGVTSVSDLEFTFQFALTDCGTQHWVTEDALIYTNLLTYSPAPPLDGLVRLEKAVIPVECHYRRKFDLDSDPVLPTWIPHQTNKASLEKLIFTLRLMSSDWRGERGSTVFFLGDKVNVEAGLYLPQMNLRVFIESCVATATPDQRSEPRYHFIDNGCLLDGRLTGSQSHFLPRERPDKLGLQLGAFLFPQVEMSQVYITCTLKAYPLDYVSKSMSKACSFIQGSWRSAEGDDWTCNSCEDRFQPTRSSPQKLDQVLPTYRPKTDPTEVPRSRTLFKPAMQADSNQREPVHLRPGKSGPSSTHNVQEPTAAWRAAGVVPRAAGALPRAVVLEQETSIGPLTVFSQKNKLGIMAPPRVKEGLPLYHSFRGQKPIPHNSLWGEQKLDLKEEVSSTGKEKSEGKNLWEKRLSEEKADGEPKPTTASTTTPPPWHTALWETESSRVEVAGPSLHNVRSPKPESAPVHPLQETSLSPETLTAST
ncbi:zona pellucida sperm-binding protein 3-like isoform X1 [Astyanax mexicanus]|uniref:Zona pellucida sperm-binding protein 3 n=1 Tax=Astyanax mexicanus TaxID=7994 RepID=A0A8T2MDV4_ASTMX|nr:zona pellucida sperm-binding protein 3-like isoform X1 [Astyanax mexicanus]